MRENNCSVHCSQQLPVVRPLLLGPLQRLVHSLLVLAAALGAVPLALGLVVQADAGEVKPLDGTLIIVAADHLAIGHLLAQAVGGLVWVDGQVRGRHLPFALPLGPLLLLGRCLCSLLPGRPHAHFVAVVHPTVAVSVLSVLLPPGALAAGLVPASGAWSVLVALLVMVASLSWSNSR